MHDEMHALLNAYLDGELQAARLQQVEEHLASCEDCRRELEELRRLSGLLQALPAPLAVPADRFAAGLNLSLPRRPESVQPRRSASWVWFLVPAGLLFAWFFIQAVLTVSGALSLAGRVDLLGNASALVQGGVDHSLWFDALSGILGGQSSTSLGPVSTLDQFAALGSGLFTWFFLQACIALLYGAWLAAWWFTRRPLNDQQPAGLPQS